MGEAKRHAVHKEKTDAGYDNTSHHLLSVKHIPDSLVELRNELFHHQDIVNACKGNDLPTFESVIGMIATKLNIALDGDYIPDDLFKMLTTALKNRSSYGELNPHLAAPGLKSVGLIETEGSVELLNVGELKGTIGAENTGTGPYTVCNRCTSTFDCCSTRSCKIGSPAVQLERSIELLKGMVN